MIAGTLEIQMQANLARLQQDMSAAQGHVGRAMGNISRSVEQTKSVLSSLGIGLGIGYFVTLIKGSIDAADHLNDLSKTTDIAVEKLAGLRLAAKQSGGDLEGISLSISRLSQNMGKDAEKFAALGVTAKDPLEAFKQLSDVFVAIQDPQQRAAVMAQALGRSWAGAAPLLAEGSKRIGEMVETGSRLSGVTREVAVQADEFNDKWAALTSTGGVFTRLVGPMLPILNSLADDFLKAGDGAKGLDVQFKPLAETLKALVVLGANVSFTFQTIGKEIARAAENVKLIAKGDFAGSRALGEMFKKDAEDARKALDEYQNKILGLGLTAMQPAGGPKAGVSTAGVSSFLGLNKSDLDAQKKLLADGEKGWIAYADAVFRIAEEEANDQVKINDEEAASNQRLIDKGTAGWVAMAEAKVQADFEEAKSQADLEEEMRKSAEKIPEFWKQAARSMQSSMSDLFFDVMQGNITDLGQSFKRTIDRMLSDMLAAQASMALFGKSFGQGGDFSSIGGLVGAGIKALGFGGDSGASAIAANNGNIEGALLGSFAVGTDYVPRTGPYQLHQGEKVIPASENTGGDINIVQHMTFGSDVDRSTLLVWAEQVKRNTIAAVADQAQRGGSFATAIRGR